MPFLIFTIASLVGVCALITTVCWSFRRPRGAFDGAARAVIAMTSGGLIATWLLCAALAPHAETARVQSMPLAIDEFRRGGVLLSSVMEAVPAGFDMTVGAGAGFGLFLALAFFAPSGHAAEMGINPAGRSDRTV